MKLYVATHNQHKVREISQILPSFDIVPDDPEGVEENAPDFIGNALIKVRAIAAKHAGEWCMADDSGLEVRALGGAPGVRSARYAGEPCSTPANNALLLKNLAGAADRKANFTCAVALVDPEGREHTVVGKCFGRIAESPSGAEGFGYDPLFIPDGHDKSFAELTADEKNAISHRGRALSEAKKVFERRGCGGGRNSPWLRLFRVVNLPTVPGDVLVGAASALAAGDAAMGAAPALAPVWWAALASVFLYMFGLAHNDIVGAKTDRGRPVSDGEISPWAARAAAFCCLLAVPAAGFSGGLPWIWFVSALGLLAPAVYAYNITKWCWLMGLCRGLNVLCGAAALGTRHGVLPVAAALLWCLYISLVTKYSEGEEDDPARRRRVGALVGGVVYLQLAALVALALAFPRTAAIRTLLVAGAALLALLRLSKTVFPRVSAS